jgi:hypothetical protein
MVESLALGAGTPTSGLTPALLSSVDPSGMLPPATAPIPPKDGEISVPVAAEPDAVAQPPDNVPADPIPLTPPPSNVELAPDDIPPGRPPMAELDEPKLQVGDTAGLRPPGLISVAPRPMPALVVVEPPDPLNPIAPLAPGIPSGDTTPNAGAAGVVDMVCAAATPQLNKSATAAADNRRIEISCPLSRRTCGRLVTWISIEIGRAIKLVLRTLNLISQSDHGRLRLCEIALACAGLRRMRRDPASRSSAKA